MEQSCYRCGAAVEEGVPFCPHCNAPQIRVAMPEAAAGPEPAGITLPSPVSPPQFPISPSSLHWNHALPAAAMGGVLAALTMATPLGVVGIGPFVAGALAVFLYRRRMTFTLLTGTVGAKLGAMAGSIGFAIYAVLFLTVLRASPEFHAALLEALDKAAARNPDPQVQQWAEYFKTPQGLAIITTMAMGLIFAIAVLFSVLGGVLGARWLRRRDHF